MKLEELKTIEQLSQFLEGTQSVIFQIKYTKEDIRLIARMDERYDIQCGHAQKNSVKGLTGCLTRKNF